MLEYTFLKFTSKLNSIRCSEICLRFLRTYPTDAIKPKQLSNSVMNSKVKGLCVVIVCGVMLHVFTSVQHWTWAETLSLEWSCVWCQVT